MDEAEAMDRAALLLRERIIREITPIFDTTALGYSSMLVAAKVDSEQPHRAARIINEHPGVSHNYLRNHEFNLWFTIATAPDSKLGLDGTLEVLRDLSGAESIRKLPTLTMFKINMNLEMEGGTDKLAAPVEAVEPQPRDPVPIDDFDVAVIRALQGPMEVRPDPTLLPPNGSASPVRRLLEHLEGMVEPKGAAPRGGDLVPPPRGLLGQRHGRLEGARGADRRDRPADGRGPRGLALLPAPDLSRLALQRLHDGPRPLEGGVRCRARRRRRGLWPERRGPLDALLLDRVQEDPPALLHARLRGVGAAE